MTTLPKDISDAHRQIGRETLKARLLQEVERNGNSPETISSKSSESPPEADIEDNEDNAAEETPEIEFPLHLLPEQLSNYSQEVSKSCLVPSSLPAVCALGTVSAAIGAGVVVNSGGGRITRGNLFLLPIAKSGTGKGQAFHVVVKPLHDLERRHVEEWKKEKRPDILTEFAIAEKEFEIAKQNAAKAKDTTERGEYAKSARLAREKMEIMKQENREPIWTVGDTTREAMTEALSQADRECLASMSAEARGVVDVLAGRYTDGKSSDEDVYLSGYSGDSIKVNRKRADPIILNEPCLSALWLMQPDKMEQLLQNGNFTESGLLPRFDFPNTHTEPQFEPEHRHTVDAHASRWWMDLLAKLTDKYRKLDSSATEPVAPFQIQSCREAEVLMRDYFNEVVTRRRSGGDLADVGIYAARWGEKAWKLAVVLHAALHADAAHEHELSAATAGNAISLQRWFAVQQLAVLQIGRETKKRERLASLVEILTAAPAHAVTVRNLDNRHNFTKSELDALVKDSPHKLVLEKIKSGSAGRPSEIVRLL